MTLQEQIEEDIKSALKAGEKERVSTLRMLKNMIHNKQIDAKDKLSDDQVESVIKKSVKQRKESIEAYESAGNKEQAAKEAKEAEILQTYLPEQLSDDELSQIIDETIEKLGEDNPHRGKLIGAVMKRVGSRADGNRVASQVNVKLNE